MEAATTNTISPVRQYSNVSSPNSTIDSTSREIVSWLGRLKTVERGGSVLSDIGRLSAGGRDVEEFVKILTLAGPWLLTLVRRGGASSLPQNVDCGEGGAGDKCFSTSSFLALTGMLANSAHAGAGLFFPVQVRQQ